MNRKANCFIEMWFPRAGITDGASSRLCQMSYPLEYTPRKFAIHQDSGHLIIIETDHNAYTEETKQARKLQMAEVRAARRPGRRETGPGMVPFRDRAESHR